MLSFVTAAALLTLPVLAADGPPPERAEGRIRHFHHTETTSAPPSAVWARWMDVATWPMWDTELTAAQADAPLAMGVTGTVTSGKRTSPFTIVAFEPQVRYVYEVPLPAGRLVVDRRLEPLPDGGTRFTHDVQLKGFGGWLLGPALGSGFRKVLPQVMRTLREQAESGPLSISQR